MGRVIQFAQPVRKRRRRRPAPHPVDVMDAHDLRRWTVLNHAHRLLTEAIAKGRARAAARAVEEANLALRQVDLDEQDSLDGVVN